MIYSVRLYTIDPASVPVFLAAFRRGGLWTDTARFQSGHIHTDLLRNPYDRTKFLSIEFWTSVQAFFVARNSPEVRSFTRWLSLQAIHFEGLGNFVFPPQPETEYLESGPGCAPGTVTREEEMCQFHHSGTEVRL